MTAAGVAVVTAAALLVPAAHGTTSVSGGDPGTNPPVIRGNTTTITSDSGALMYYRSGSAATVNNAAYVAANLTTLKLLHAGSSPRLCQGNDPAGINNSPRQIITVTDPNNVVIHTEVSPARDISGFGSGAPLNPQPAPSGTNYIGDYPGTGGTHGMSFTLSLAGHPAGTYTVTTKTINMTKSDKTGIGAAQGPCVPGVPDPSNGNKSVIANPPATTSTFVYRPWQNTFVDVFGAGKIFANTLPREFQFSFGNTMSNIMSGDNGVMRLYAFPSTDPFLLPPSSCLDDPVSCVPAAAVPCDPADGCTPRIMTINEIDGAQKLQGTFDLQTKAFIARANMGGVGKLLVSTGTENDALIGQLLAKLVAGAAARGIDLQSLLDTEVRLANGHNELDITLLQGLQLAPSSAKGVQIVSDTTVQAGLILDLYFDLRGGTSCTNLSASNTSSPPRFASTVGYGYTVQKSDILPSIPSVGPLGTIASGPLFHITGKFADKPLANIASAVIGLDSAANEPNGYPVWVEPFLSTGHVNSPKTMDFLGTATWSASQRNIPFVGCLLTDTMLGTGVALYNNPLPVGFGTLLSKLYQPSAASEKLLNEINAAVQQVVNTAGTNPTVVSLLNQLLGALPA
jgi:hypothetical protein